MKYKTTKKAINGGYATRICVGYCSLQHLLQYEEPVAYTTRTEGWGADIYAIDNVAIITGYAPFGDIRPSYDLCKRYNEAALKICCDSSIKWEEQKVRIYQLLKEFVSEVTA